MDARTITQYLAGLHQSDGLHSQVVRISTETRARLRNLPGAARLKKGVPTSELHWKHFFPQGVQKRAISRVVMGADYSSTVNVARQQQGLAPNFTPAPLWRGKGAAHPAFPAEMSYHVGTKHQVLRALPYSKQGKVVKDVQQFVDLATGKTIAGKQLEILNQFLAGDGQNYRQGATFDDAGNVVIPGELESGNKVPWRTFGAENIRGIRREGETKWTPIAPEKNVPEEMLAAAGGPPPVDPPQAPPAAPEPEDGHHKLDYYADSGAQATKAGLGRFAPPDVDQSVLDALQGVQDREAAAESEMFDSAPWSSPPPASTTPPSDPEDSDRAARRNNAAFAYRKLGATLGALAGGALGGPAGASVGGGLGGLLGKAAGGGKISGGDVVATGAGILAGIVGGGAGTAINAIGTTIGAVSGSGGGEGTGGGGAGQQEDDPNRMLREIRDRVRRMDTEGVYVRRDSRNSNGSQM